MKSITLLTSLILVLHCGFSQNENNNLVEDKYVEYFKLNPETIYTHVNKSKFSTSETLWFKTYIYDTKTQKPYLSTTNVYAAIYDAEGHLIEKKVYYAKDGMTHGDFSLAKNYSPGIYFLKVSTNWMRNFNESRHSLQKFMILDESVNKSKIVNQQQKVDFQLLPEGGHLVENTNNSIGFKAIDFNGDPLIITLGKVLDSNGNILSSFKSNTFGIGKFNLFIKENESYRVEITVDNGTIITKDIPKADPIGIGININNINDEILFVNIKTNSKTLPSLLNGSYYFLIHRDGLYKKIDIAFETEKYEYLTSIPKNQLFDGINILTLFNDKNQPVLERLLFNKKDKLINDVMFLSQNSDKDSTQIKLASRGKNLLKQTISVSILPAASEAYESDNTITLALLLKPYIKGHIENPSYYFKDNSRKTNHDLDLLLLTQGWSSYNWKNIFYKPQIAKYNFETGFQIKGKINSAKDTDVKEIILFSEENELMVTSEVKNTYFNFDNLSLMDSSVVSLSAKNIKGKLVKPQIYYNVYPTYVVDSIKTEHLPEIDFKYKSTVDGFIYDEFVTQLDTVLLSSKKQEKEQKFMVNGGVNNKLIDLETYYSPNTRIIDIIRNNGFEVRESGQNLSILSRRVTNFRGALSPSVSLDYVQINSTLDFIQYLTVFDVEALYISRIGYGMNSPGGAINIFTKKGMSTKSSNKSRFNNNKIKIGFSIAKNYYSPAYDKTKQEIFAKYGVLNWIPNLSNDENGFFIFKIPNYYYDSINLYIEGICEDGSLISKTHNIKL
ncbi:hypothetical protein [Hanstruepera ponticola]|uniref:hypothetical protein n=1 Tax=Hanstruepera ponticola TaxID=2042995 RepID=UPI000CF143E1|nr:hypothetical protein [Hanstruepera ponticola]